MNPKLVAAVLVGGTFVLGGGSALLAELPSPARSLATEAAVPAPTVNARRSSSPTTLPPALPVSPTATAPKAKPAARVSKAPTPSAVARPPKMNVKAKVKATKGVPQVVIVTSVTYRVRSGDTASSIAQWFERHGYGAAYAAHRAAIDGLNHLVPGELISIVNGKLTVQPLS
jgi:hypothetical protein